MVERIEVIGTTWERRAIPRPRDHHSFDLSGSLFQLQCPGDERGQSVHGVVRRLDVHQGK